MSLFRFYITSEEQLTVERDNEYQANRYREELLARLKSEAKHGESVIVSRPYAVLASCEPMPTYRVDLPNLFNTGMSHDDVLKVIGPEATRKIEQANYVLVPKEWREKAMQAMREQADKSYVGSATSGSGLDVDDGR